MLYFGPHLYTPARVQNMRKNFYFFLQNEQRPVKIVDKTLFRYVLFSFSPFSMVIVACQFLAQYVEQALNVIFHDFPAGRTQGQNLQKGQLQTFVRSFL